MIRNTWGLLRENEECDQPRCRKKRQRAHPGEQPSRGLRLAVNYFPDRADEKHKTAKKKQPPQEVV